MGFGRILYLMVKGGKRMILIDYCDTTENTEEALVVSPVPVLVAGFNNPLVDPIIREGKLQPVLLVCD